MNQAHNLQTPEPKNSTMLKVLAAGVSYFVIGIGCLVLIGWAFDISALESILPGLATMKSMTALLFVLCGISLWMRVKGQARRIAQICALIVAFVGLITLLEYLLKSDFGIDQLLFRDDAVGALHPGRMAPSTALAFILVGAALAALDSYPGYLFIQTLVLMALVIASLAVIGYLYGVSSLYQIGVYSSVALHTAVSFILLCIGILFARPGRGLIQTIWANTAGGNILRRFLPTAILAPILLGWIRLWGQRAGLYDTPFGLAIMVVSTIAILMVSIWVNARQLTQIDIQRQLTEINLRENELRFRSTLDGMMEGCQIIGYDWRYLYINASAEKHNRRPNQELMGKIYMDMWPGIESTAVFLALQSCMSKREAQHMINEFVYPDGSKGWFELGIQPVLDGIFILSSDITRHKQAEQALLEREMKLTTLFEILPVGISILDRERKVSYTNPALKKILDISEEGLLNGTYTGRKYLRTDGTPLPIEERASTRAFEEKVEIDGLETGVVKESGNVVWTEVSAVPVNFSDWKVVMVTSDITERKLAEERFRLAIESAPNAVIMVDQQGKIVLINSQTEKYFGYQRAELIGEKIDKLVPMRFRDKHANHRAGFFAEPKARSMGAGRDLHGLRKDGIEFPVEIGLAPISTQQGILVIATVVDITQRKKAEGDIHKLNAELEKKVAERTAELATVNKQLQELAIVDELTGLYNRRGFLLLAEEQLLLARRAKWNMLLFYADLDSLKQINDQFGHIAGDEAIVKAARALNATFRTSDIKARLGGDEFVVLAMEAEEHNSQILQARLHQHLAENNQSMSIGVITFNAQKKISLEDLVAQADKAMYAQKRGKQDRNEE